MYHFISYHEQKQLHTLHIDGKQRQLSLRIMFYEETLVHLGRMILETIFSLILQNSDIQNQELYNLEFLPIKNTLEFIFS